MNSTRVTRPVPLLLFGSTLFAIGCLGAASSQVTESGADYGVSEAVTENATTPPKRVPGLAGMCALRCRCLISPSRKRCAHGADHE
ncbi:hypothetical protein [Xanthomonas oryzae]|uniref:hypothetical protein n=1 Tax=Xanthomonas oryzae TaxID=347 RepID=UPI00215F98E9|nr:hypothetical protein [Xanthomonas oryzae]